MSVTVRFIGDGQTTVTDINSNSVVLRRRQTVVLADSTWTGYSAQYQSLFEQIGGGNISSGGNGLPSNFRTVTSPVTAAAGDFLQCDVSGKGYTVAVHTNEAAYNAEAAFLFNALQLAFAS